MFNWFCSYVGEKIKREQINRWICAGASEGLEIYKERYGTYPGIVVDIGAHHGGLSIEALRRNATRVIALEASKDNCNILRKNLKKYKEFRWMVFNFALVEYPTPAAKLISYKSNNSGQKSLVYKKHIDCIVEECIGIDRRGLLALIKHLPIVDYLKIDIEGGELYALPFDAYTRELFKKVRFLDIELHSLDNSNYFDKQTFLDTHSDYNKDRDMIVQFVEFLGSCGFYLPLCDVSGHGAVKIMTANKFF